MSALIPPADHREDVYLDESTGLWVYRASGGGRCFRAIVAQGIGYESEHSEYQNRILGDSANQGNLREQLMLDEMVEEGIDIIQSQPVLEVEVIKGVAIIRGRADAVLHFPDDAHVGWEAKSMSERRFSTWIRHGFDAPEFYGYAFQVSAYMWATGLPFRYDVKRRDPSVDKAADGITRLEDLDEITLRRMSREVTDSRMLYEPPIPFSDIRKRIIRAETWRRKGELPPCDITDTFMCPFLFLHEEEVLEGDNVDEGVVMALDVAADEFNSMMELEREAKKVEKDRKERLSPELLRLLGEQKKVETDQFVVSRRKGSGERVDWDGVYAEFREGSLDDLLALVAKHTRTYEYEYPTVKRKN